MSKSIDEQSNIKEYMSFQRSDHVLKGIRQMDINDNKCKIRERRDRKREKGKGVKEQNICSRTYTHVSTCVRV